MGLGSGFTLLRMSIKDLSRLGKRLPHVLKVSIRLRSNGKAPVDPFFFDIEFPTGTKFYDERKDIKYVFVIHKMVIKAHQVILLKSNAIYRLTFCLFGAHDESL